MNQFSMSNACKLSNSGSWTYILVHIIMQTRKTIELKQPMYFYFKRNTVNYRTSNICFELKMLEFLKTFT